MSHTIGIDNSGVVTSLFVKDHPDYMWYREAIQNALEATESYIKEKNIPKAEINIRKLHLKGLIEQDGLDVFKNKLCVLNLGGMTATELMKALKLGGSGKTASLTQSYGIGIKTSVLNWSDLLIITYKNKIGHYAYLGTEYTDGINFVIKAYTDDGQGRPVEDCSDWIEKNAKERGYDLTNDFTEIVILGKEVNQDTYINTFGFGPDGKERKPFVATHIKENLCKRYFRLPENIKIKIDPSANNEAGDKGGAIIFKTFVEAFDNAVNDPRHSQYEDGEQPRSEIVVTEDDIKIHYFWDGPCGQAFSTPTNPATNSSLISCSWPVAFSGIVWKNEIYDPKVNTHRTWKTVAFRLGIQDNFSYFRIFVELPDRAGLTDKYRTILQTPTGDLAFDSDETLYMIMAHMPDWYKEKTKATKKENKTNFEDALKSMFSKYMYLDRQLLTKPSDGLGPISKRTQQNKGNSRNTPRPPPTGLKRSAQKPRTNPQYSQPDVPTIQEADDPRKYSIEHNFCCLVEKGGENGRDLLIYNPNYKAIEKIAQLAVFNLPDPDLYFDDAKNLAKESLVLNSALWVMICRIKIASDHMTLEEFQLSISSNFMDTYIFARELQIAEEVERAIKKQKRDHDKIIDTEENLQATFNLAQMSKTNGTSFVGNEYDESVA